MALPCRYKNHGIGSGKTAARDAGVFYRIRRRDARVHFRMIFMRAALIAGFALGSLCCSRPQEAQPPQAKSGDWVENLGGWVSRDFKAFDIADPDPGGVAYVNLGSTKVTDSDLRQLRGDTPLYGL